MPFEFSQSALPTNFNKPYGRAQVNNIDTCHCTDCNRYIGPVLPADDSFVPGKGCRCLDCLAQFKPGSLFNNDTELKRVAIDDKLAESRARALADQINQDRAYIKERLQLYGNAVLTKWKKMSEQKRTQALLTAEPDLYKEKWPEAKMMFGQDYPEHPPSATAKNPHVHNGNRPEWFSKGQRLALLMPYLNVETLATDPMKLLSLLHHRTSSLPEEWVSFDVDQMRLGWNYGCLMEEYNGNCVSMHGEQYGALVPWEKEGRHSWMNIGYPRAKLVLVAQSSILRILRSVVDQLAQPGRNQEGSEKWHSMITSGFRSPGQAINWSAFSNQPFSAPPSFDPHERLDQARAQLAAAQDHLQFLQSDPLYLRQEMSEKCHLLRKYVSEDDVWRMLANETITLSIRDVQRLKSMVDQCEYIAELHDQHNVSIQGNSPLPTKYQTALAGLEFLCFRDVQEDSKCMQSQLPTSPGFAKHYKPKITKEGNAGWEMILPISGKEDENVLGMVYRKDPLVWAITELTLPPANLNSATKSRIMAEIDDRLTAMKDADRVDRDIYHRLSKIETQLSMIDAIRHYRPSIEYFDGGKMVESEEVRGYCDRLDVVKLAAPEHEKAEVKTQLKTFFETPWPKGKRDQRWADGVALVRQKQAAVWNSARESLKEQLMAAEMVSTSQMDAEIQLVFGDFDSEQLTAARTQEIQAQKKLEGREKEPVALSQPPTQTQWGSYETPKFAIPVGKVKPKTKGEASTLPNNDSAPNEKAEVQGTSRPTIAVSQDSLRIFAKMLSSRLEDDDRGVIAWDKFIAAMVDAGFSATHTGGSEVTFKPMPNSSGPKGRIVFHKPHPTSQIGSIMLSSMGKRLRKWFVWDVETFVERKR